MAQGYQVWDMEVVRWIHKSAGKRIPVKRDQQGSDLGATNGVETLFVQCKSGEAARTGTFPAARREFAKYLVAPNARQVVIAWPPLARQPRIVDCAPPREAPETKLF